MADPIIWTTLAVKVLEKLVVLVDHLNDLKDQVKKLNGIIDAWERTGWLKDVLIDKYENDKISTEQKEAAKNIHRHLIKLQEALKELKKIANKDDDDDEFKTQSESVKKMIDKIIELFVLM